MERIDAVSGSAETADARGVRQEIFAEDERDAVRPVKLVADQYLVVMDSLGKADTASFIVQGLVMADAGPFPESFRELGMVFEVLRDLSVFLKRGWHRFAPSKRVGVGRC